MVSLRQLKNSIMYAARGISHVIREEQNFRIQLAVATLVIVAMFFFDLRTVEKAILALAIVLVLVLELLNTIFERVVDLLKPRIHHYVEEVKDVMAGVVLVAAIGAALIGALIFWPYIVSLLTMG